MRSFYDAYNRFQNKGTPLDIHIIPYESFCGGPGALFSKSTPCHQYCFLVTLLDHAYWIIGSVLGSLLGSALPLSFEGVEFVLTALFVTLFVEQWLSNKNHLPALAGVMLTAVCLMLFGGQLFLIPSMVCIALLLTVTRKTARRKPYV